ncbi:hypothetical protein GCM10027022_17270 [Alpinimonas psychrophila]
MQDEQPHDDQAHDVHRHGERTKRDVEIEHEGLHWPVDIGEKWLRISGKKATRRTLSSAGRYGSFLKVYWQDSMDANVGHWDPAGRIDNWHVNQG